MKIKYTALITAILVAISVIIGLYYKSTYTDYKGLEDFSVAMMKEDTFDNIMQVIIPELGNSDVIVKVRCDEEFKFRYKCASQRVTALEVYKGDTLKAGDTFEIIRDNSTIGDAADDLIGGMPIINMGFVNEMTVGKEYLVFLGKELNTYSKDRIYLTADYTIVPIFACDNVENIMDPTLTDGVIYTSYDRVSGAEFFVLSDNLQEKVWNYKQQIFNMYMK